jgi:hypothetical protein
MRDTQQVEKGGNQSQSGDQQAPFNIEAHEAKVAIRQLTAQCTSKGDHDCRKPDKRQRQRCETEKVVRFCGCHDASLLGMGAEKETKLSVALLLTVILVHVQAETQFF